MKEIIREVLEAEKRVDAILKEARQRASEMRRAAEEEIAQRIGQARQEAREVLQAAAEEARREAERLADEKLAQADQQRSALLDRNVDAVEHLVEDICRLVLSTERQVTSG